jgi:hypothetical protein
LHLKPKRVAGVLSLSGQEENIHAAGEVIPPGTAIGSDSLKRDPFKTALVIATIADLVQIILLPLFAEGGYSPLDDVLDVAAGAAMVRLIGWHWAFLPSFLGKLIPLFDEVPCWTLAVLFVRAERAKLQTEISSQSIP